MAKLIVTFRSFSNAPKKKHLPSKCAKKNIIHGFSLLAGVGGLGRGPSNRIQRKVKDVFMYMCVCVCVCVCVYIYIYTYIYIYIWGSRKNVIDIVTPLRAEHLGNRVSIPGWNKGFISSVKP